MSTAFIGALKYVDNVRLFISAAFSGMLRHVVSVIPSVFVSKTLFGFLKDGIWLLCFCRGRRIPSLLENGIPFCRDGASFPLV